MISLIFGYITFWLLAFVLGGGIHLDIPATPLEKAMSASALPAGVAIFLNGVLFSLFRAISEFRRI